jgi:hypothetical protein
MITGTNLIGKEDNNKPTIIKHYIRWVIISKNESINKIFFIWFLFDMIW